MLSQTRRITREEFKKLGRGRAFHSPLLSLFVYTIDGATATAEKQLSKFAFSCSKKVSKSAVVRNKLRRRGYVGVRKMLSKVPPGFFFVFVYKKGAEKSTYQEVEKEVQDLLKKV